MRSFPEKKANWLFLFLFTHVVVVVSSPTTDRSVPFPFYGKPAIFLFKTAHKWGFVPL